MAIKYSKQRAVIKEFLQDRKDHPTADVVYTNVRKAYPNISLGTVYRNLMLLSDMGEIQRLRVGDGSDHFDPNTNEHNHFVCRQSGDDLDLEMDDISGTDQTAAKNFRGKIDGQRIYFYGICEKCLQAEQQNQQNQ